LGHNAHRTNAARHDRGVVVDRDVVRITAAATRSRQRDIQYGALRGVAAGAAATADRLGEYAVRGDPARRQRPGILNRDILTIAAGTARASDLDRERIGCVLGIGRL